MPNYNKSGVSAFTTSVRRAFEWATEYACYELSSFASLDRRGSGQALQVNWSEPLDEHDKVVESKQCVPEYIWHCLDTMNHKENVNMDGVKEKHDKNFNGECS